MVRIGSNSYNSYMSLQTGDTKKSVSQNKDAPLIGNVLRNQTTPRTQNQVRQQNSPLSKGINNQLEEASTTQYNDAVTDNNQYNQNTANTPQNIETDTKANQIIPNEKEETFIKTTIPRTEQISQKIIEAGNRKVQDMSSKIADDSSSSDTFIGTYQKTSGYMQQSQTIAYNSKEIYQAPEFLKTTTQKAKQIVQAGTQAIKNGASKLMDVTPESIKTGANSISNNMRAMYNSAENSLNNISNNVANNSGVKWVNNKAVNIRNSIQEINPLVETRHINGPNGEIILNTAKSKGARTLSMAVRSEGAQIAGKALGRVAVAYGIYEGTKETYKAFKNEGKTAGVIEGAKQTGGLVGAYVGGKIGVAIGAPIVPPVGAIVGGVVGGAVGYVVGSGAGKKIGEGVAKAGKAVVSGVKTVVKAQVEVTKKVVNKTVEMAKEITPEPVKKAAKAAVNALPAPVKNAMHTVGSWFGL